MIPEQGAATPGSDRQGAATAGSDRQGAATAGSDPEGAGDPRALCGEHGSGTINSVALILLALALAVVLGGVGTAHREQARLQAVADLAALAGAEQSATAPWEDVGERPCAAASSVAAANGVALQSCDVRGSDCLVVTTQSVRIAGISTILRAKARAGPGS